MRYLYILFFTIICFVAHAQERIISGTLKNDDGEPLVGINIVIKGTNKGVVTDLNGQYTIKVPIGGTLVFSGIGLTTKEVKVDKYVTTDIDGISSIPKVNFLPARMFVDSMNK